MNGNYYVNEIFSSIDGEGIRAGSLATFIRLAGCNMRCSYCDTAYSLTTKQGKIMTAREILEEVKLLGNKHITLTGGEPLMFDEAKKLIDLLVRKGFIVNIETNGSIDILPYKKRNVIITMDYKTPSSLMEDKMFIPNLEALRRNDVLKFVCAKSDLPKVEEIIKTRNIKSWIYLSPIFNEIEPAELVDFLKSLDCNTEKIRVQLQMHKYIWNPNKRGV